MGKKTILVLLAITMVLSAGFIACAKPAPTPTPEPGPAAFQWPERLSLGAPGVGTGSYMVAGAWATELETTTGMTVRVVPEGGTVLRFRWLRNGIIDLFVDGIAISRHIECYRPEQRVTDGGPFPMRMIMIGSLQAWGFVVRADGPIQTIHDINPQTKVAFFPPPSDMTFGLLNWLGLNKGPVQEDAKTGEWNVELVPYSGAAAWFKSVNEGKADIVCATAIAPPIIEQAAGPHGVRVLELPYDEDPDGAEKLIDLFPVLMFGRAPEVGVKEMWGTKTIILPQVIFSRADLPDDVAYNMVKWFDENYGRIKDKAPTLDQYSMDNLRKVLDMTTVPVHDGVIRYLKEKGMWTAADDARQEYNLRLLQAYTDAWEDALDQAMGQQIQVSPESEEFAALWSNLKKERQIPRYRAMIGDEKINEGLAQLDSLGF
ncbi:TAXI family TRAP transporter solute-binding subunit [Chloroflexota bacterium]